MNINILYFYTINLSPLHSNATYQRLQMFKQGNSPNNQKIKRLLLYHNFMVKYGLAFDSTKKQASSERFLLMTS